MQARTFTPVYLNEEYQQPQRPWYVDHTVLNSHLLLNFTIIVEQISYIYISS